MPAKGKGRAKAASNHKLADPVTKGTEMKDLKKKSWFIGEPIGSGGFGLIYLAGDAKDKISKDKAQHVIKVEPHGNGPLFCEIAFYQRAAKAETINTWRKRAGLSYIGIPAYIAHGLHTGGKEDLRFMVMPRYGSDLQNLWVKADKKFNRGLVCQLAIQLINALEYMHCNDYVHADVKGGNILLGYTDPSQIYLVDFGLAFRYMVDGKHKEYHADPRKAHDGTIEYTSRDAHHGVAPSRRSDLEILGYVLLHWISGRLPWEDKLTDKNYVKGQKIAHMSNVKKLVTSSYSDKPQAIEIEKFIQYVAKLDYEEEPDYVGMRKYFQDAMKSMGISAKAKLQFDAAAESTPSTSRKRRSDQSARKKPKVDSNEGTDAKRPRKINLKQKTSESQSATTGEESDISHRQMAKNKKITNMYGKKTTRPRREKIVSDDSSADESSRQEITITTSDDHSKDTGDESDMSSLQKVKNKKTTEVRSESVKKTPRSKRDKIVSDDSSTDENSKPAMQSSSKRAKRAASRVANYKESLNSSSNEDSAQTISSSVEDSVQLVSNYKSKATTKKSAATSEKQSKNSALKSRYSMAPLHTESVLGKHDKLTGEYLGKHPVIIRRRKKRRQTTDAVTQTTPSLKKRVSRT